MTIFVNPNHTDTNVDTKRLAEIAKDLRFASVNNNDSKDHLR